MNPQIRLPMWNSGSRCIARWQTCVILLFSTLSLAAAQNGATPVPAPIARTVAPTLRPTTSPAPTKSAQPSLRPSRSPTMQPTTTPYPTHRPSISPSDLPSRVPSKYPTVSPTFNVTEVRQEFFGQFFLVPDDVFFNTSEAQAIMDLFASYTARFSPNTSALIDTACSNPIQGKGPCVAGQNPFCPNFTGTLIDMDYTCTWSSNKANVTNMPLMFLNYTNSHLSTVEQDISNLGVAIEQVLLATIQQRSTLAPSISPPPSRSPTLVPTNSPAPTITPFPSDLPSTAPTIVVPDTLPPAASAPSVLPVATGPPSSDGPPVEVIVPVVILVGLFLLGMLALYYRHRKKKQQEVVAAAVSRRTRRRPGGFSAAGGNDYASTDSDAHDLLSPSESVMSKQSMLSAGDSQGFDGDSVDEVDGTNKLQDEFDKYRDQNLEQLRSDVEKNLTGFEGIMSAAVTNAILGDGMDPGELLWGCQAGATAAEVEASALCEVNEWLKRNENATTERKRAHMQEMLNKMVASVRYGVIFADDASRTVHEMGALLGLPLKHELPTTTVLITGMRKMVEEADLRKALKDFGEIDVAAVASRNRGFGIVRFRHPKSAERALQRYRNKEIVVQDVAVVLKPLTSSGM